MSRTRVRSRRLMEGGFRLLAGLVLLPTAIPSQAAVIHVSTTGSGADGSSWATSFQAVAEGLLAAASGDEIWVAGGTYNESIHLNEGVSLYGGFEGTEPANETGFVLRDWTANETILDATGLGTRVVTADHVDTAEVSGFTIRNGSAEQGGGVHLAFSSLRLSDCVVEENIARFGGGIFVRDDCAPTIENSTVRNNYAMEGGGIDFRGNIFETRVQSCLIDSNTAETGGGGIHLLFGGRAAIQDTTISNNHAFAPDFGTRGGGVHSSFANASLKGCRILRNSAYAQGGGVFVTDLFPQELFRIEECLIAENFTVATLRGDASIGGTGETGGGLSLRGRTAVTSSVIRDNTAAYGGGINSSIGGPGTLFENLIVTNNFAFWNGGGLSLSGTSPLINCTVTGNHADRLGGGLQISQSEEDLSPVRSCVLWGNTANETAFRPPNIAGNLQIIVGRPTAPDIQYCDIEGGWPGEGNIDTDPLFRDPDNGDYRLGTNSPCIDSGDTLGPLLDLAGESRPIDVPGLGRDGTGDEFDMGAYEFEGTTSPADLNGDGYVNAIDLLIFQNQWKR